MLRAVPFYFLRHGQTDWNLARRFQGQTDIPLNAYGELQARNAAHVLQNETIASICSSPLLRARRTAEIVASALNLPVILVEGLREVGFGEWEGTVQDHATYGQWRAGEVAPRGAETAAAFNARVLAAMNAALDRPGPVLVVAHGGVYWGVERAASLTTERSIANAAPIYHAPPGEGGAWSRRMLGT